MASLLSLLLDADTGRGLLSFSLAIALLWVAIVWSPLRTSAQFTLRYGSQLGDALISRLLSIFQIS
jgi:hypothetical protein